VVDSSGEKVGRINDLTFTFDGTLKLSQFILAGSKWEEFLESAKIKPDKDPVLDASIIRMIGDEVHLNTNVNSLKTTLDEGAIPDGTACLIVGGGFIEETLEDVGLKADVDILVPSGNITSIRGKIILSVSKEDLKLTMDNAFENPEVKKARERPAHERAALRVRLNP
jgi:sporulation protein YlmC with PRC-barrel domain